MQIKSFDEWESNLLDQDAMADKKDLFELQQQMKKTHLVDFEELYTLLVTPQKIGLSYTDGYMKAKSYVMEYRRKRK